MSKLLRKIIHIANAPKPIGPYNQAVRAGNTVYVSGMLGVNPPTNKLVEGGASEEAKQALKNLDALLQASDSSLSKVVKSTIYLDDLNDFSAVNEVYKQYFKEPYPARSTFQIAKLPLNAKIEIEVVALSGEVVDE
ncbi:rutC family protein UK114-like [Lycorma delicatula]|uniref:rutC family protein UK114-like n=1 Tax=Lycorma delicatula TaxID=130591 RepID=UPI003F5112D8